MKRAPENLQADNEVCYTRGESSQVNSDPPRSVTSYRQSQPLQSETLSLFHRPDLERPGFQSQSTALSAGLSGTNKSSSADEHVHATSTGDGNPITFPAYKRPNKKGQNVSFDPAAIIRDRAHPSKAKMRSKTVPGTPEPAAPNTPRSESDVETINENADMASTTSRATSVTLIDDTALQVASTNFFEPEKPFKFAEIPIAEIRVRILSHLVRLPGFIQPSYNIGSVLVSFDDDEEVRAARTNLPPLDIILGTGNKQFSADALTAFYGSNRFKITDATKGLWWLRRIGDANLARIKNLTIVLQQGNIPPSALAISAGKPIEKPWAMFLAHLTSDKRAFRLKLNNISVRVVKIAGAPNAPDPHDPLHDFSDKKYRFACTTDTSRARFVNEILRALIKVRAVKGKIDLDLGEMAGWHWKDPILKAWALDREVPDVAVAYEERKAFDQSGVAVGRYAKYGESE